MENLGLAKVPGESNYDFTARIADFMQKTMSYAPCDVSPADQETPRFFDAKFVQCQEASALITLCARSQGVPARVPNGILLHKTTGKVVGYHCIAEVFDPERGWFPVDGANIVGSQKSKPLFNTFGKDEVGSADVIFVVMHTDGVNRFTPPGLNGRSLSYPYDFWAQSSTSKTVKEDGAVTFTVERLSSEEALASINRKLAGDYQQNVLAKSAWHSLSIEGSQGKFTQNEDGTAQFDISKVGPNPWSSQFSLLVDKANLKPNQNYELMFWAKADKARTIGVHGVRLEAPYDEIAIEYHPMEIDPTGRRKTIYFTTAPGGTPGQY